MKKKIISRTLNCLIWILILMHSKDGLGQPKILLTDADPYNLKISSVVIFQIIPDIRPAQAEVGIKIQQLSSGELVYEAKIPSIEISNTPIMINSIYNGYFTVYQNSKFVKNDLIRYGKYQLCVSLKILGGGNETEKECKEFSCTPINPPALLSPEDNSKINLLNPILTWIPPTPIYSEWTLRYQMNLVEIFSNQSSIEAIKTNLPIYSNQNIHAQSLMYPFGAIPLEFGKSYAWNITAYDGDTKIGTTEVWKFTPIKDSLEQVKEYFRMMSFSKLLANPSGECYSTGSYFCIQFYPCPDSSIPLDILDFSNTDKILMQVDVNSLLSIGDNKYVLDIGSANKLKKGNRYTLRYNCNNESYKINFLYQK